MKTRLCIILLLLWGAPRAQVLEDYLIQAADSNSALQATYWEYQSSLEKVPQATSLPDPEVGFGFFIRPVETRVGPQWMRVSAMQMFPWFGTLSTQGDIQAELAKARLASFKQGRDDLFFRVEKTYYELYQTDYAIKVSQEHLRILKSLESISTTRLESNTGSMVDVLRIQLEISEVENELIYLQESVGALNAKFNQLLNRDSNQMVRLPDTLEAQSLVLGRAMLSDSIQANNNTLSSIYHRQMAAKEREQLAKKLGAPSFGVGITYILTTKRKDVMVPDNGKDPIMPMLTLRLPLYREKYNAQMKEAEFSLMALESLEQEERTSFEAKLEEALVEYDDAGRRIDLAKDQIAIVQQALALLNESYANDGKDFEEVLRMQRKLLDYKLKLVKAVVRRNIMVARISSWM